MIAVDTNLLVYAHREDSAWHDTAYTRITELAEGRAPWAIPWPCIHEFLAIVTHPPLFLPPRSMPPWIKWKLGWSLRAYCCYRKPKDTGPNLAPLYAPGISWGPTFMTLALPLSAAFMALKNYGP